MECGVGLGAFAIIVGEHLPVALVECNAPPDISLTRFNLICVPYWGLVCVAGVLLLDVV